MAISNPPPRRRHAAARGSAFPHPEIRVRYSNLQPGQQHIAGCDDACEREPCRCVCHQGFWNAYTRACVDLMYVEDLP